MEYTDAAARESTRPSGIGGSQARTGPFRGNENSQGSELEYQVHYKWSEY
jgi:hypothetical protein